MADTNDITHWSGNIPKYRKHLSNLGEKKRNANPIQSCELRNVKPIEVYALIDAKLNLKPNGFYTSLIAGLPMDNLVWWDFVIESDIGFINIIRNTARLEAQYSLTDSKFDIDGFFADNIKRYQKVVDEKIKTYEKHKTFINHYMSYKKCADFLWEEISSMGQPQPSKVYSQIGSSKQSTDFAKDMENFTKKSIKFHALGKSLVLNAAFTVESFLNLLIRVGAPTALHNQKHLLRVHLSSNIETKLRNLHMLSRIIEKPVDMNNPRIKKALELMTLRNKYVHADENSPHNNLGFAYFDEYYPLFDTGSGNPIFEGVEKTYLQPDLSVMKRAYETSNDFIEYIQTRMDKDAVKDVEFLMRQNPIGFNVGTNRYSIVYPETMTTFFMITGDSEKAKKG